MRAKNLALRVLSTAAMLSIVTSIAAPAFAATYYINDGSVDVAVSKDGIVTVEQGGVTYTDTLDGVVIRGGTRSEGDKGDDRVKADASPATQEADGSNTPAVNETEAPKSENTAGDTAPKQETTAAGERKEGTPQQEPTEEEEEEEEQQEPTEEKVTPEPAKAKTEAFRRAGAGRGRGREAGGGKGADRSRCPHSTGGQQQHQHPRKADRKRHHHCQQPCQGCQAGFFVCAGQCEY